MLLAASQFHLTERSNPSDQIPFGCLEWGGAKGQLGPFVSECTIDIQGGRGEEHSDMGGVTYRDMHSAINVNRVRRKVCLWNWIDEVGRMGG